MSYRKWLQEEKREKGLRCQATKPFDRNNSNRIVPRRKPDGLLERLANSSSFGDLVGTQAASAHVDPLGAAIHEGTNPLDVRIPATLGANVGVTDAHAKRRLLAANVAY